MSLLDLYRCRRRFVVPMQIVININSIDSTVEPIFAELRAQLDAAISD